MFVLHTPPPPPLCDASVALRPMRHTATVAGFCIGNGLIAVGLERASKLAVLSQQLEGEQGRAKPSARAAQMQETMESLQEVGVGSGDLPAQLTPPTHTLPGPVSLLHTPCGFCTPEHLGGQDPDGQPVQRRPGAPLPGRVASHSL